MYDKNFKNSIKSYLNEDELDLGNYKTFILKNFLYKMILIRESEFKIATARKNGLIKGPVHLGIGQEAIPVGISEHLLPTDKVFGAHRSHSHILSLGVDLRKFFAELLAKATGISKGMGGSMHLYDESIGFMGSVPIVGATVPLAVGTSLSTKLKGNSDVSVSYFGDGAIEEGVVQESFNFARINKCPVLFVVENNQFSSHLNIKLRQPKELTSRFAKANDIEFSIVDGNNIIEVSNIALDYVSRCRKGDGPFFIEAITYRWLGHVDWREDVDVGVNRSMEDIKYWKSRDPVKKLKQAMIKDDLISNKEFKDIQLEIENKINFAWDQALKDPDPNWEDSKKNVYSKRI